MKLKLISITAALLLLLCSCQVQGAEEEFLKLRTDYLNRDNIELEANIRAEQYGKRFDFRVTFTGTVQSGTVDIIEPEEIRGVKVSFDENGRLSLFYDEVALDIGEASDERLSPAAAVPFVLNAICSGFVTDCHYEMLDEIEYLSVSCDCTAAENDVMTECTLLFDTEDGSIYKAECSENGNVVIYVYF